METGTKQCECGCGGDVTPGRRFVNGHNRRGVPQSPETREKIAAAQRGEKGAMYGRRPPNFKGRIINAAGYVLIHAPEHPFAPKGTKKVMEHRLVMERHLRAHDPESRYMVEVDGVKYLARGSEVHHLNEDKADNRIENLRVMSKSEHTGLHAVGAKYQSAKTHCPHGHPYDEANTIHERGQRVCRTCQGSRGKRR